MSQRGNLRVVKNRAAEERPGATATIGATLQAARKARGLSIDAVFAETRILPRFLRAIEDGRFETFAAPVYAIGFTQSYARFVTIDPDLAAADVREALDARMDAQG
jgi:cytoskeletal protein RodZ